MAAHQRLLKAAFSVYADHKQGMLHVPDLNYVFSMYCPHAFWVFAFSLLFPCMIRFNNSSWTLLRLTSSYGARSFISFFSSCYSVFFLSMAFYAVMISSPQGPVPGRTVSTIGLRGFTSMLADAGQLDHVVTEATVGSLYAKVLHFPDDGEQMTEMGFTEFCDAIGALAQTKIPDPYLPLDRKLDAFLTGSFELGIRPILRDAGLR